MTPLSRDDFAITSTYLNHAAVGVLPKITRDAIHRFVDAQAEAGVLGTFGYEAKMPEYRAQFAALLGGDGDEIALLRNTGDGATVLAQGVDWKPGDELILCHDEFPSNVYPWLALRESGVNVRLLSGRLTPERLRTEITTRTRAVVVSWVSYFDGYRHDIAQLADIAHAAGAYCFVDVIQGLGALHLDVRETGIDAAFGSGAKWMLALQGVGYLWVRRSVMERLRVALPGWRSVADMWAFHDYEQPWIEEASRYEGGTPNFLGALSLATSATFLREAGTHAIQTHILALRERLIDGLSRHGLELITKPDAHVASGIVTFRAPVDDQVAFGRALQAEGFITTWRPTGIRVAPHGYNTDAEIDAFVALVAARIDD